MWSFDGDTIATLLGEFGQAVVRRGASVIALKNAILGVGDRRSGLHPLRGGVRVNVDTETPLCLFQRQWTAS